MYYLDKDKFYASLASSGYSSVEELAKSLGVHRNTIHYYLKGKPIISTKLSAIIKGLGVGLMDIISKEPELQFPQEPIAALIDQLLDKTPEFTYVLFGSRARKSAKKYSDFDIGVYREKGIPLSDYLNLLRQRDELEDDSAFFIDLVNLNNADREFITEISKDWIFLGGKQRDWLALQKLAGGSKDE